MRIALLVRMQRSNSTVPLGIKYRDREVKVFTTLSSSSILSSTRCNRAAAYQHVFPRDANHVHPWAASRFVNLLAASELDGQREDPAFSRIIRNKTRKEGKKMLVREIKEGCSVIRRRGEKWEDIYFFPKKKKEKMGRDKARKFCHKL